MITDQAGMRQLITLDGGGVLLHGTYHKATSKAGSEVSPPSNALGVVFMNALSSPRSLAGDSGVYWATSFAAGGYPCFRFDLPGLGDSYGEIPNDLLKFTNQGGYGTVASVKTRELVEKYGLSGVVMFGHCAGATTAIYAASTCSECKGLVLMDPYFNLPKAITSTLSPGLVLWARRSRFGGVLRAIYDRVREFPSALRRSTLPTNANFSLISRLKEVVVKGLPILILRTHEDPVPGGPTGKPGVFDYFAYIRTLAVKSDQFSFRTIEDTDHSFANRTGQLAVRQHTETWLRENFPDALAATPMLQPQDYQVHAALNPM